MAVITARYNPHDYSYTSTLTRKTHICSVIFGGARVVVYEGVAALFATAIPQGT
jgi:hypothetical protein